MIDLLFSSFRCTVVRWRDRRKIYVLGFSFSFSLKSENALFQSIRHRRARPSSQSEASSSTPLVIFLIDKLFLQQCFQLNFNSVITHRRRYKRKTFYFLIHDSFHLQSRSRLSYPFCPFPWLFSYFPHGKFWILFSLMFWLVK